METIDKSVDVDLPVQSVYNQWTQFEDFPQFMEGVTSVQQLGHRQLQWEAVVGGKEKKWTAEISDQQPERRIAWRATSGTLNCGRVDFEALGDKRTRVHLHLDYLPEGVAEDVGDTADVVDARVDGDLRRFKNFVEHR